MWISKSEADYVANGKVGRMSVLIKGIDLPKKCGECDIYVCYRTWNGDPGDEFCGITKEDVSRETKPDWCPLSEVPERKKGKWIVHYECPKCGEITKDFTEYCPFCNADMRGEQDETRRSIKQRTEN